MNKLVEESRRGAARTAHLDEIAPVDLPRAPEGHVWIPVRHELGVEAFGVNAYVGVGVGDEIIGEHNESEPGDPQHQELYFVARGHAAFVVNDEQIDAPTGAFVFVGEPSALRSATALEPNTTVLVIGSQKDEAYSVSAWERKYTDARQAGS